MSTFFESEGQPYLNDELRKKMEFQTEKNEEGKSKGLIKGQFNNGWHLK